MLPQSIVRSVMGHPTRQRTVGNLPGNPEVLEILETRINRTNRRHNRTLVTRVLEGEKRKAKATVKVKGKANETHVADEAMMLDEPDVGDNDSDITIRMEGLPFISSFFLGKPGESSTTRIDDEEILDWGDNDDGMESAFMAQPNTSFRRMSF